MSISASTLSSFKACFGFMANIWPPDPRPVFREKPWQLRND